MTLTGPFTPELPIYEEGIHKLDITAVCSLHVWIYTMNEWTDIRANQGKWQSILNEENIENLRILLLLFALSANPDFLLYDKFESG